MTGTLVMKRAHAVEMALNAAATLGALRAAAADDRAYLCGVLRRLAASMDREPHPSFAELAAELDLDRSSTAPDVTAGLRAIARFIEDGEAEALAYLQEGAP